MPISGVSVIPGVLGLQFINPKGSWVLVWGDTFLNHNTIIIPNIETLHSTIKVLRTLWEKVMEV